MNDLVSLSTKELRKHLSLFASGTEEWWEIRAILLFRQWHLLYGPETASEMYQEWLKLPLGQSQALTETAQQLTLDIPAEE